MPQPTTTKASKPQPQTPDLKTTSGADLKTLPKKALAAIALAEKIPADGTRQDILGRLQAAKAGGRRGYEPGLTLCKHCGHQIRVTRTVRGEPGPDGRYILTRYLKCRGPRRHRYTADVIKET
tara:strand:- start:468 stop:836 length:369 start_codon:yes stop_codon:yes gene_type:complete